MSILEPDFDLSSIKKLSTEEKASLLRLLSIHSKRESARKCRDSFFEYASHMVPRYTDGYHIRKMAETFERVEKGETKRVIICMAPRHSKSMHASHLFPSWYMGRNPDKKIIQCSNTAELAVQFGRQVRDTIGSDEYREIFPDIELKQDSKAAGRWSTNKRGEYFAIGVQGTVSGKGADLLVVDDPHSEQEAAVGEWNPDVYDRVYEWYTSGPRQRLQPGAAILIVMTRWSMRDLVGQLLEKQMMGESLDEWEVIEFPAILESGQQMWPEFWSLKELEATRSSLPIHKWESQYQQNPIGAASAIVKRDWWRIWTEHEPPTCTSIIQSWDTAYAKGERANHSACTTWGVFNWEGKDNLILLDALKEQLEFPELKVRAKELYDQHEPDILIVEKKGSGGPLIYELRAMGLPVSEFTPTRGRDKITRVNSVAPLFEGGLVWAPDRRFAHEVIEEMHAFPAGKSDDLTDSTSQALIRFRQGGMISLDSDDRDDDDEDGEYFVDPYSG